MSNEPQSSLSDKPPRLTPELVVKMVKEKGTAVSILEAEEILKFMRKMAKIAISNYLDKHYNNANKK